MIDSLKNAYETLSDYDRHYSTVRSAITTFLLTFSFAVATFLLQYMPTVLGQAWNYIRVLAFVPFAISLIGLILSSHFQRLTHACRIYMQGIENFTDTDDAMARQAKTDEHFIRFLVSYADTEVQAYGDILAQEFTQKLNQPADLTAWKGIYTHYSLPSNHWTMPHIIRLLVAMKDARASLCIERLQTAYSGAASTHTSSLDLTRVRGNLRTLTGKSTQDKKDLIGALGGIPVKGLGLDLPNRCLLVICIGLFLFGIWISFKSPQSLGKSPSQPLTWSEEIGPFPGGISGEENNQSAKENTATMKEAEKSVQTFIKNLDKDIKLHGIPSVIIVVGSFDKRSLKEDSKQYYGENAGLARSRADWVITEIMQGCSILKEKNLFIPLITGPAQHGHPSIKTSETKWEEETSMKDDRTVKVYPFWGSENAEKFSCQGPH